MVHELPKLPYSYDALKPHIDEQTMKIHHGKHHQGYVDKLNKAIEGYDNLKDKSVKKLLEDLDTIPTEIRTAVRNNGGGHYNHSLFWQIMSPQGGGQPEGELSSMINDTFGSLETFQEKFVDTAASRFGSGWGWLVLDDNSLKLVSTPNQFAPLSQGQTPILGVDVWEHAYYLKYQNKRGQYLKAFLNLINWDQVQDNLSEAIS